MRFVILAAFAAYLLVPFVYGLVKGPERRSAAAQPGASPGMLRPLARVADLYSTFLVLYVIFELWSLSDEPKGYPAVCADTPGTTLGSGGSGAAARAGAVLQSNGMVQVCTAHPSAYEWFLYALIRLPSLVVWALALLLAWRLIRQAARTGPFTAKSAATMQLLGVVIIAGTAVAAAISTLGANLMDRMLLVAPGFDWTGTAISAVLFEPLKALLPWPAIVGAALISFARITRVGAELDEEVRATV
jgi:hypothetical protein